MSDRTPFFTVFTPTYNRAHTLERVYRSLLAQTDGDFEWIVVDDGSTDGTEALVGRWIGEGRIAIRYFRQPNGGKHVAFNRGVREARGELFLAFDSDDACVPQALERFRLHWLAIPDEQRAEYSGVTCLCADEQGHVLGGPLPESTIDGRPFDVLSRLRRSAEMWGCLRTEVLRQYPFPEFPGERFVPESLVWNRIGKRYQARFVSEALRVYHESSDSLSAASVRIRARSPRATMTYYGEVLDLPVRLAVHLRAAANLWRFAIAAGRTREAGRYVAAHPLLMVGGFPAGFVLAWRDWRTLRSEEKAGR